MDHSLTASPALLESSETPTDGHQEGRNHRHNNANGIRKDMRQRRAQLSTKTIRQASQSISRRIQRHPAFKASQSTAAYLPCAGEADPQPIIQGAWERGQSIYLPRVLDGKHMHFVSYRADTPMVLNRYGIAEPNVHASQEIHVHDLDLILLPLVAFDRHGTRLGMGAGYYDRALAVRLRRRRWRKPRLIGLAYDFQEVEGGLQRESWDVPLDAVVTENRWINCS